jgi:hypothetical protein
MSRLKRTSVRIGLAAVSATGLVAAGMSGAQAAPHRPAAASGAVLKATIEGGKLTLSGDTTFPAGRLALSLKAVDKESEVEVVNLHPGFTLKDARNDLMTFGSSMDKNGNPSKKGLKALNHLINHTTLLGGLDVAKGKTGHATLLVPQLDGQTVVFNDSGQLPKQKTVLNVGSAAGPQTLPAADATVKAKTTRRFGGADVLPANGVIRFKNVSTESPHFMFMQHVKEGTTRKQVIDGLQSNSRPDWALKGDAGTDVVGEGQAMDVSVNLPAGEYALMCFFPDPKTGMPHAFMGMVKIVHLK